MKARLFACMHSALLSGALSALAISVFGLGGCGASKPEPLPDALPASADPCGDAYAHLHELSCEPRAPSSGTWVEACRTYRQGGISFGTSCIRRAKDRAEAETCGLKCE